MSPAEARIRPMTPSDLHRVMEIALSLKEAPLWPFAAYQAVLDPAAPRRIALVAIDPQTDVLVGFAVASMLPPQAELETIAVAAESQSHGVGRQLLAALAGELAAAQIEEILLEVRGSNKPARALYQSLGFSETGRRPRYYADPIEDALLLTLRLG
jgi:ribosomal-protein-alanine N-acetyltransferase